MTKTLEQTFEDVYNNVIKLGDIVAYNYSGELRRGLLRKVTKIEYKSAPPYNNWYKYEFEIELIEVGSNKPNGTMSKVKNCRSLIKI
jgi:hypothetical protein